MLSRKNRIPRDIFLSYFKKSKKYYSEYFIVSIIKKEDVEPRCVVIMSKKVLPHAVDRNKYKRRIYDCLKKSLDNLSYHVVFIQVKKEAKNKSFSELCVNLSLLLKTIIKS